MIPKHWTTNLDSSVGEIANHETIKAVFSAILELTILNDWKGACHESCGAIHILLSEEGVENTWCIGETQVGDSLFDHSWIEIDGQVYDIAICKPLQPAFKNGAVINGTDIETNLPTTAVYGVVSGQPEDVRVSVIKSLGLSSYLANSKMHPHIGTWILIDQVAKHKLNKTLDIPSLMKKYSGQHFTTRP